MIANVGWQSWELDPVIILATAVAGVLYLLAIGPWRARFTTTQGTDGVRAPIFLAGLLVLLLALISPLHALGDEYLLTAHMIQHELLTLVVPPMLLFGIPPWLGDAALRRWPILTRPLRLLANPIIGLVIFSLILGVWHSPAFYQAALGNDIVHRLEHAILIAAAVPAWLPVISPFAQAPALRYPVRMLYLFAAPLPGVIIGAILGLSDGVIYPTYALAPRVWGWAPVFDQQVAGLIMWVGGAFYYFGALTIVFFVWAAQQQAQDECQAKARAAERARAAGQP